MLTIKEIEAHLNAVPFKPFRIRLTDGKPFDVTHPDLVILTKNKAIAAVGPRPHVADHVERCALIQIVRIEELQAA